MAGKHMRDLPDLPDIEPSFETGPRSVPAWDPAPEPAPAADAARKPRAGWRVAQVVAGVVAFAIGAVIFLYPTLSERVAQEEANEAVREAVNAAATTDDAAATDAAASMTDSSTDDASTADAANESQADELIAKRSKEGDAAYAWLEDYNARVAAGEGGAINDPWGLGSDEGELAEVGLPSAIIGTLYMPVLGENLPLYLGSSTEHLSQGVAVISGTSAPLGQEGSNVVIAGHRSTVVGMRVFRDVENIQVGDLLVLDTLWDTLYYRVKETRIIQASDEAAIKEICAVQPGRDLVTLVTCHPYTYTYQRYVVVLERSDAPAEEDAAAAQETVTRNAVTDALQPTTSTELAVERWVRVAGLAIMATCVVVGAIDLGREIKRRTKASSDPM